MDRMSFKEPSSFERILTNFFTYTLGSRESRAFAESLPLGGDEEVLDYGSGNGATARFIAERLDKGGRLTCVDISEVWHRVIRENLRGYDNVRFLLGDILGLDAGNARYDLVTLHFVLHDLKPEERPARTARLAEALKPGGRLVIEEPKKESHGIQLAEIRTLMDRAGLGEIEAEERKKTNYCVFERR